MPRWKALPEELDPQIREFASQLRRLVDRSGMSVATIADRTGYSKSSWERYLNGRLLPPRGATQALAEVTGTDVRHLGTMWELAERAWSRSEMRHDVTMEAIQVAQARAALGEFADEPAKGRRRRKGKGGAGAAAGPADGAADAADAAGTGKDPSSRPAPEGPVAPSLPSASDLPGARTGAGAGAGTSGPDDVRTTTLRRTDPGTPADAGTPRSDRSAQLRKGLAGGAGAPGAGRPSVQAQSGPQRVDFSSWGARPETQGPNPTPPGGGTGQFAGPGTAPVPGAAPAPGAGGEAGGDGFDRTRVSPSVDASAFPSGPAVSDARPAGPAGPADTPGPAAPGPSGGRGSHRGAGRRRVTMFLAGIVGALVVIAAAVFFFDQSGEDRTAKPAPSPSKKTENLPSGVKCSGKDCSGKDPEGMGCGGQYAKTSSSAWVGRSYVEVRYSKVCKASWARITSGAAGDRLKVVSGGQSESTTDSYTRMVSVRTAADAKACATLVAGNEGCTVPGRTAR